MDRYCPACNTFKDVCLFDQNPDGKLHRICIACEELRATRAAAQPPAPPRGWGGEIGVDVPKEFRGVDIDRIHYVRGAVRAKKAA